MSREAFEAEMRRRMFIKSDFRRNQYDRYKEDYMQKPWEIWQAAWQASRAAALEEAAKVCEEQATEPECPERAQYCVAAIRQLAKGSQ